LRHQPDDGAFIIDPVFCEGCATCVTQCPEDAIAMQEQHAGRWYRSLSRFGPLFHAHLFAGQENSGKLVTLVKQHARLLGTESGADLLLVDGPPGIGCPVISACSGADLALLVVEPTVSGIHDLERVLATTSHFGVPAKVIVNKADVNAARAADIARFCDESGVMLLGEIPFSLAITDAMVAGLPATECADPAVRQALSELWSRLRAQLG
jgi:MinD superfamily P-loop ATPase